MGPIHPVWFLAAFAQGSKKSRLFTWTLSWTQEPIVNPRTHRESKNPSWIPSVTKDLMPRDMCSAVLGHPPPTARLSQCIQGSNTSRGAKNQEPLLHFLDRFWLRFKPLGQPNWLLLRLHTPGSGLAVSGGAIWSKISWKGPKKEPKCDYFLGIFFEAPPKPLFWLFGVKMGSQTIPKIDLFGTPETLLKCSK